MLKTRPLVRAGFEGKTAIRREKVGGEGEEFKVGIPLHSRCHKLYRAVFLARVYVDELVCVSSTILHQ